MCSLVHLCCSSNHKLLCTIRFAYRQNLITPSYVAFTDNGDRLVGDAAKNQATINPENTIFDVKRLIGRNFSDKSVVSSLLPKLHLVMLLSPNNQFSPAS